MIWPAMPASSSGCRRIRVDWGVPFYVEADDCFLADELFRHAEAFEMFWHAEGMKLEYEGDVVLFLGCVDGLGQCLAILGEINFDGHDDLGDSQYVVNGVWAARNPEQSLEFFVHLQCHEADAHVRTPLSFSR